MQLISQELIPELKVIDLIKAIVDNKSNRWFEVNLLEDRTTPEIIKGLAYKPTYKEMNILWNKVKVKKIVPKAKNILSEQLSKVELYTKKNKYELTLFGKFNEETGYFVTLSGQDKVFFIEEGSKDFFFSNVQDFWEKKIDYQVDFTKVKSFTFKLGTKKKQYGFKVENIEKFKVETDDNRVVRVKEYNINLLFNLVLNLVEFKEAKYVTSQLTRPSASDVTLYMHLFGKELFIIFKQNSITVQDLSGNVEYFYPHKISSINVKGQGDFFTLK